MSSFKIYLVCLVCSKYTQHVFLISQTQYFLITLWVYFLWATRVKCDYIDSVYYECAKNMPPQYICWRTWWGRRPKCIDGINNYYILKQKLPQSHDRITWLAETEHQQHCDHMTQYILNVTTKEWLKHLLITFFGKFKKYWVFADGVHCGYMIQYFLNILTTYWAAKLQIHCSVYSERTQHVLIQESVGILDMEPPCTKHILAQYRGCCPLW